MSDMMPGDGPRPEDTEGTGGTGGTEGTEAPGEAVAPEMAEASDAPAYDPAAPEPLGVPRTATTNADVDAQLQRLADVDHLATDGHVEVYEDVHEGLRDALTALDARQGPPAPARPGPYDNRS